MSLQWELGGISRKKDWFHTSSLVIIHWTIRFHLDLWVGSRHTIPRIPGAASLANLHETTPRLQQSKGTTNVIIMTSKGQNTATTLRWEMLQVIYFLGGVKNIWRKCVIVICIFCTISGTLEQTSVGKTKKYFQFGQLQQLRLLVFPGNQNLHPAK